MPCYRTPFESILHWPHLDFGTLGREKQFVGCDLVFTAPEGARISVGYDQRDRAARTIDYEISDDTLPGQIIPIAVAGPSFDLRITFNADQAWEWQAANIYVQDMRIGR